MTTVRTLAAYYAVRTWVSITADGNPFVNAVGIARHNIVKFVRHSARSRYISDAAWSVQFRRKNIVHHPTGVADFETTRLDSTNGCRANYVNSYSEI